MKKLLAFGAVALLAVSGVAYAVTLPEVSSIGVTDMMQIIPQGIPTAQSVFADLTQLRKFVFTLNSQNTGLPAATACGTAPVVVGFNYEGTVTMGTGSPTGCVLTFATPFVGVPNCVVTSQSQITSFAYSLSATAITIVQTGTSSNKANWVCAASAGG